MAYLGFGGVPSASDITLENVYWAVAVVVAALVARKLARRFGVCTAACGSGSTARARPSDYEVKPDTCVFAFDLHEVVMFYNFPRCFATLLLTLDGWRLLAAFALLVFSPSTVVDIVRILRKPDGAVAEEILLLLVARHARFAALKQTLCDLWNCFDPDEHTVQTIAELKHQKFSIYLFSNIGEELLEDMRRKYDRVFVYFDGFFVASARYNYVRKPNPRMFELAADAIEHDGKLILFVDDQRKNTVAAEQTLPRVFRTYLFTTGKQLYDDMKTWGVI